MSSALCWAQHKADYVVFVVMLCSHWEGAFLANLWRSGDNISGSPVGSGSTQHRFHAGLSRPTKISISLNQWSKRDNAGFVNYPDSSAILASPLWIILGIPASGNNWRREGRATIQRSGLVAKTHLICNAMSKSFGLSVFSRRTINSLCAGIRWITDWNPKISPPCMGMDSPAYGEPGFGIRIPQP